MRILFVYLLALFFSLGMTHYSYATPVNTASASASSSSYAFPNVYAVYQQQADTCFYVSWLNLGKIREIRAREEGRIVFQDSDYVTKLHSYALALPSIHGLDRLYDELRQKKGPYFDYETLIRQVGIKSDQRYSEQGVALGHFDESSLDSGRREGATPYNLRTDKILRPRWLPLLIKSDGRVFYYSYVSKTVTPLESCQQGEMDTETDVMFPDNKSYRFSREMLEEMNLKADELQGTVSLGTSLIPGFPYEYYLSISRDTDFPQEHFYDVGAYHHMLFACGVDQNNRVFDDSDISLPAQASREFRAALKSSPRNPWHQINKDDLFEYHLARIFQSYPDLKARMIESVNFFNSPWKFYQEGLELYDNNQEPKTKLRDKTAFLPGEDQMLAYFVSKELTLLYLTSIDLEAVIEVLELEEDLDKETVEHIRTGADGAPTLDDIKTAAKDKNYGSGADRYSFLDIWSQIKQVFLREVVEASGKRDFVSFNSHGSVISFDDELIGRQEHEDRELVSALGFARFDSLYDKALKPFYRRPGVPRDRINPDDL